MGLDSERVFFLVLVADWALGLGMLGDEPENGGGSGGGSGADFLLLRVRDIG